MDSPEDLDAMVRRAREAVRRDPHGPTDRYSPAPGTAQCPYCAHVIVGMRVPAAARTATFQLTCPGCGRDWLELRAAEDVPPGSARRYYPRKRHGDRRGPHRGQ